MPKRRTVPTVRFRDIPSFVETKWFTAEWERLGLGVDAHGELQWRIALNPRSGTVIPGAPSLRKLRFAPARAGKGKSGSLRVMYGFVPAAATVLLLDLYPKSERDDLPPGELAGWEATMRQFERRILAALRAKPRR